MLLPPLVLLLSSRCFLTQAARIFPQGETQSPPPPCYDARPRFCLALRTFLPQSKLFFHELALPTLFLSWR